MRKVLQTGILFLLLGGILHAQVPDQDSIIEGNSRLLSGKTSYRVSLGSEFTTIQGHGSGVTNYISPSFSYRLSKRMTLGGGITLGNTTYFDYKPWYSFDNSNGFSGNVPFATLYVTGQYLVNERLLLSGTAYKSFTTVKEPLPYNPFNPIGQREYQGFDFNVGYKIGDNMLIQAGFRYSNGNTPNSFSPLGPSYNGFTPSLPGWGQPFPGGR